MPASVRASLAEEAIPGAFSGVPERRYCVEFCVFALACNVAESWAPSGVRKNIGSPEWRITPLAI